MIITRDQAENICIGFLEAKVNALEFWTIDAKPLSFKRDGYMVMVSHPAHFVDWLTTDSGTVAMMKKLFDPEATWKIDICFWASDESIEEQIFTACMEIYNAHCKTRQPNARI